MIAAMDQRTKRHVGRKKGFPFFLVLSCLIHALLIILIAILFARSLMKKEVQKDLPPPEVTLEISPPSKTERPFIQATTIAENAPKNSSFQSDQNSQAASEKPPDGTTPIPSQQGIVQPALELLNQKHTQGEKPATSAGSPVPPQPTTQPVSLPKQAPSPQKPNESPAPTATPINTPKPQSTPLIPPPPNNLRLLEPPESPTQPPKKQSQTINQSVDPTQPHQTMSPGSQGSTKGYQPETRQTVIKGNISNRGRSSVAAEATPLGRYRKGVADAIGSRWYYYVDERMGLLSIGTVDVSFKVTASGKVSGLHVISSNGNESLTDCSLRSIMDAKIPPIPSDVARTLQNGVLEIDYSFTVY
jgi:outer membrane biosynthesis protein TonB